MSSSSSPSIPKTTEQIVKHLIPDSELQPKSIDNIPMLTSFADVIKKSEKLSHVKYAAQEHEFQQALVLRRIQQLTAIALLNPLWKERIEQSGLHKAPVSFEEWQNIPICDKTSIREFFTGDRPGMALPLHHNGFEIVASGGTSNGLPSETVYSLKELNDTYRIAGDFIGNHMLKEYLGAEDQPKWLITTLADYQMWSSGTMVGGVLQCVPGINYIGAGPVSMQVFQRIMSYKGAKAIMGITQSIASLIELGAGLSEEARNDFRVAMYGSGILPQCEQEALMNMYPNLSILSYFAATQAEAIGLQLHPESPYLASVPGLHLIEIVDENGQWVQENREGELVVTRLHATEAPVLRFRIGDRMIRRSDLNSDTLKTVRFEFVGRSSDILHICDTQYPAKAVYVAICKALAEENLFDPDTVAHEVQFINDRKANTLSLLIAVNHPEEANAALFKKLGYDGGRIVFMKALNDSLSVFNKNEANQAFLNRMNYRFSIRFVSKMSPEIYRTEVGKTPLLKDIL
jgi:phenylacetate-CoA ligase